MKSFVGGGLSRRVSDGVGAIALALARRTVALPPHLIPEISPHK